MKWVFTSKSEADDFARGEARYNESYCVRYDEESGVWVVEIFGRRTAKLFHGYGIA